MLLVIETLWASSNVLYKLFLQVVQLKTTRKEKYLDSEPCVQSPFENTLLLFN